MLNVTFLATNNADCDEMSYIVSSHLCLHCLLVLDGFKIFKPTDVYKLLVTLHNLSDGRLMRVCTLAQFRKRHFKWLTSGMNVGNDAHQIHDDA